MKHSEDALCRLFANQMRDSQEFRIWVLAKTKFQGGGVRLLHDEQIQNRPTVKAENWWRHWWRKIPELSQERETDIFLVFEDNADSSRFALHIENKQDAKFAPGQAEDYEPRARWMMATPRYLNYADFQTMLTRIIRDGEELSDGCGKKRAIHVANRCLNELRFGSALRHSRHERRYAASFRPSICSA